jgi:hypothetical protein
MAEPILTAEDRSIAVPPGQVVRTAYVPIGKVDLACRARMAIGDVKESYERQLQLGSRQPWPCPRGFWQADRFVVEDGRHQYVASLMLGLEFLLVAWLEESIPC